MDILERKQMDKQEEFTKVERYKCKWCGKEFITTKHHCKFSPKRKNCFSCKHCKGFDKGHGVFYNHGSLGFEDYEERYFICDKDNDISLEWLWHFHWDSVCDDYETMDDYKGKSSYAKVLRKQELSEQNIK